MVVGTRRDVKQDAGRKGHAAGNALFNIVYRAIFGTDFTDIFSGYRVFTRRYAKSFPAMSPGFEIETEMSVHASELRLPVIEVETDYGKRQEGSESKLSTFKDGFKILCMMASLMKETRPFMRGRNEVKRIHYLSIAPSTHTQEILAFGQPKDIETDTRQAAAPAMKAIK